MKDMPPQYIPKGNRLDFRVRRRECQVGFGMLEVTLAIYSSLGIDVLLCPTIINIHSYRIGMFAGKPLRILSIDLLRPFVLSIWLLLSLSLLQHIS